MGRGTGERCYGYLSDDGHYAHCTREENAFGLTKNDNSQTFAHLLDGECKCGVTHNGSGRQEPPVVYPYHDANGKLLYELVRQGAKDFRFRRPNGNGGWIWNLNNTDRVLYRLPEIVAANRESDTVFVVEGEKDVDCLRSMGFVATTNPGGAGKWRDEHSQQLNGFKITIIPDNDDVGRSHAEKVAKSCSEVAMWVKIVSLPGPNGTAPPKGWDVSDWCADGGTPERLHQILDATPVWKPGESHASATPRRLSRTLADLEATVIKIEWLWPGWIPLGFVTLVAGRPGVGKSLFVLQGVAAPIIHPDRFVFPDGNRFDAADRHEACVVWVDTESTQALTVQRAQDLEVERTRIHLPTNPDRPDDVFASIQLDVESHCRALNELVRKQRAPLVIVDSLLGAHSGDERRSRVISNIFRRLANMAANERIAIVVVDHLRKAHDREDVDVVTPERIRDSSAKTQYSRSIVALDTPKTEDREHVRAHVIKTNLTRIPGNVGMRVVDPGIAEWDHWDAEVPAPIPRLKDAKHFLNGLLASGAQPQAEVKAAAEQADHSWRTVERAKADMGIRSVRLSPQDRRWFWQLPNQDSDAA